MRYFITAIGTDSGKTIVSAIVAEMLEADYWKPVQAGYPRDTETVESLITNKKSRVHPEGYLLQTPASPHASAKIDHVEIQLDYFKVPQVPGALVIEGAGGALVPINDQEVVIDMVKPFDCEIILVSDLYLGSINHTLLTIEALKHRDLPIKGIVFNGEANVESEKIILSKSGLKYLLHIEKEPKMSKSVIRKYADKLAKNWE